ncbi:MAG TPA: hypothetical protein VFH31_18745, partial [Pyrinomonadaceae bacterium]|nr:hypothetical protein [Pyrinomonadaceae bacterium]
MYKVKRSIVTFIGLFFSASILLMNTQLAYGQGSTQNVRVVNTSSQPVPTTVQGTTTVTGSVNITNVPTVALSPSANSVQAQQTGTWNVGITGTPTVNLTPGTSVGITGTPNVSLVPGTSVAISNTTANPIPVQNVGAASSPTTLVFNSGTVAIPNVPGSTNLGEFNASAFSRIRVVASSNCGWTNVSIEDARVFVFVVEGGQPVQAVEELKPCMDGPTRAS